MRFIFPFAPQDSEFHAQRVEHCTPGRQAQTAWEIWQHKSARSDAAEAAFSDDMGKEETVLAEAVDHHVRVCICNPTAKRSDQR